MTDVRLILSVIIRCSALKSNFSEFEKHYLIGVIIVDILDLIAGPAVPEVPARPRLHRDAGVRVEHAAAAGGEEEEDPGDLVVPDEEVGSEPPAPEDEDFWLDFCSVHVKRKTSSKRFGAGCRFTIRHRTRGRKT